MVVDNCIHRSCESISCVIGERERGKKNIKPLTSSKAHKTLCTYIHYIQYTQHIFPKAQMLMVVCHWLYKRSGAGQQRNRTPYSSETRAYSRQRLIPNRKRATAMCVCSVCRGEANILYPSCLLTLHSIHIIYNMLYCIYGGKAGCPSLVDNAR